MAKGANAAVLAKLAADETQGLYLYQATPDGITYLRYAGKQSGNIVFGGETWKAADIKHTPIEQAKDTRIDETTLTFPLLADELASYIAAGASLSGWIVDIYKVFRDALDDPTNYIHEFHGETDAPEYSEVAMSVRVRRCQGTFAKLIPRLTFMPICPWPFKVVGSPCGYAGATATCDHTITACAAMAGGSNVANFGGCPWQPHLPAPAPSGHGSGSQYGSGG